MEGGCGFGFGGLGVGDGLGLSGVCCFGGLGSDFGGAGGDGLGFGVSGVGGCGCCFGVGTDGFGFAGLEGDDCPPHFALLQSTGLLTTGWHCFDVFCFGLSGKQLLLSSITMSFLEDGSHSCASPLK